MEILSSPFLAPLTFYPAPTTLFCLPSAARAYAITPIPTACIASQPSLQPLHVPVICSNAARVLLKLRPSHVTPFDTFNSIVFTTRSGRIRATLRVTAAPGRAHTRVHVPSCAPEWKTGKAKRVMERLRTAWASGGPGGGW